MSSAAHHEKDGVIGHVLIVIAMEAEAAPLLKKLDLTTVSPAQKNAPCQIHSGMYKGCKVSVVTNGKCGKFGVDNVGTVPAALSTFLAVSQLNPDLIINAGTAGGFKKKGAAIGDAYICSHMMNHDRRIPIPGFTEYGTGSYTAYPSHNIIKVGSKFAAYVLFEICQFPMKHVCTHTLSGYTILSDQSLNLRSKLTD